MTLQTFLQQAAPAPAKTLRRAMTNALSVERPSSPESYGRFYRRVIGELDSALAGPPRSDEESPGQDGIPLAGMCCSGHAA